MFNTWKDETIRRRALLRLMSLAPLAGLAATDDYAPHTGRPNPETVQCLDRLIGNYEALYHDTAPAVLLTPVVAHLETMCDGLRQATSPALRRALLAHRARLATLAGRLAFFDLREPMTARAYYGLALEAAQEAGDDHLAASALGHMAFIPAADYGFVAALDYLRGAEQHLARDAHGPLSSWLAAIESEMHTKAGSRSAALAAIDRAREELARPGPARTLPWFDYYDETRLAGFAGYAELEASRFDDARKSLTEALDPLPPTAVKQRAVFLTDFATVHLSEGDIDEACRMAAGAAEELHHSGYAIGSDRLRQFRGAADPWSSSVPVRLLDEQLAAIA